MENVFLKSPEAEWKFDNTASKLNIGCRIFHLNPPMIPPAIFSIGLGAFKSANNIGAWAWELEEIPLEWTKAIRYMNAFFCPSEFTSRTIRKYTDKPVLTVPHPIEIGAVEKGVRRQLQIPDNAFLVSNVFSFGSAFERKNPCAAVNAFIGAFGHTEDAYLVLKSNAGRDSVDKQRLLEAIKPYPNIRLIDDFWPRERVLGLIKESNVYLSLHRSEGFGLPIAEAMSLGTPTVVTNWSGNTDFCTEENSFPIGHDMLPVRSEPSEFAALSNLYWADAKTDDAAAVLRSIYENGNEASAKASRCIRETNRYFSSSGYSQALEVLVSLPQVAPEIKERLRAK